MLNKKNWEETKIKWTNYWKRQNTGTPLMCIVAKKEDAVDPVREAEIAVRDVEDKYFNAERMVERFRYWIDTHEYLAESFPNLSVDFGPGSMAGYLGCNIKFARHTVWFEEFLESWEDYKKLEFDPENEWFKKHIELFKRVRELAGEDFYVAIPDIMENIDVLASIRGAQDTIFDMMDEPEEVEERIRQVQDCYFEYYDRFYDIAKINENGKDSSCYTVFQIWGEGKTGKLQCDFSAMMSPTQFRDFIVEPLREQAKKLDHVLYHLDGPDAIRHLDALMEIEEIDALQWTSGSYNPDGTHEEWFEIYDKAVAAGKALWVQVYTGTPQEWIERIDKLVARYGSNALFLYFNPMPMETAQMIMKHAEENWKDIEGSYVRELKEAGKLPR